MTSVHLQAGLLFHYPSLATEMRLLCIKFDKSFYASDEYICRYLFTLSTGEKFKLFLAVLNFHIP